MTTTTPYTARTGLARNVIEFFVANNDEALDTNDLVSKFSAAKANIPALLKRARECGAIVYNGGLYMLGSIETARQCIADADAAPATQAQPQPAHAVAAPAPSPRSIDDATGAEWNAASAAIRAQQQRQKDMQALMQALAAPISFPGVGTLTVSFEALASRIPVSGYKWDPVLDHLAAIPKSVVEGDYATVRLPKALAGAAKAGIASWHKRHLDIPVPCQFRASVVGADVLIQCIA